MKITHGDRHSKKLWSDYTDSVLLWRGPLRLMKPSVKENFGITALDDACYINYNITIYIYMFSSDNVAMAQPSQGFGSLSHNFQTCVSSEGNRLHAFVSEEAPVSARRITIASPIVRQAAGNPLVTWTFEHVAGHQEAAHSSETKET